MTFAGLVIPQLVPTARRKTNQVKIFCVIIAGSRTVEPVGVGVAVGVDAIVERVVSAFEGAEGAIQCVEQVVEGRAYCPQMTLANC